MTKYARSNAKRLAYALTARAEDESALFYLSQHNALNYDVKQLSIDMADLWEYINTLESIIDNDEEIEKAILQRRRGQE